ncbi:DegT/DnrJ/EryC1/StrS family aminotransferase [Phyllobacterium zundukense]|uniref:DegT/DnrJ/EryC1/StrS family aminotransferase n=1 Tax=Phyllobacterium zundukense TaxID=1867719 RepID=A0ACD4CZF3_9HYPH|nr:DegT/DnrJ/EryC1/StrS family aminotransferase [Phyllobacterium zundukense]UXN58944.1 DegT/DnrJ/EryC1/StrS family aminotransferase [Phyllobacterium zundukense]
MSRPPIYVAHPLVPAGEDYLSILAPALQSRRLTNGGALSSELELRLSELFRTRHVNLMSNGTVAIEIAAKALKFKNKVITTPFTFAATVGALLWIGLDPVLVDIDEDFLTLDATATENALDDDVSGIVGVHVYGCPCDLDAFAKISEASGVPVLYDGAHVFDASFNGLPIVGYGDATTMSFHATKQFNTGEGGAVVTTSQEVNARVNILKNFGIESEDVISDVGINGKMSELNAAFGLANLDVLFEERARRTQVAQIYTNELSEHRKIRIVQQRPGTSSSSQYFAVRLPVENNVQLRDKVYIALRDLGIYTRKYFYPLISDLPAYTQHMSQKTFNLPNANRVAREILTLPLHGGVSDSDAKLIARSVVEALDA